LVCIWYVFGTFIMSQSQEDMRGIGVVTHYESRNYINVNGQEKRGRFGFVEEKLRYTSDTTLTTEGVEEERIWFHASHFKDNRKDGFAAYVVFEPGDVVEYDLSVKSINGNTSCRAYNIRGIQGTKLPCQHGVRSFLPHYVALRQIGKTGMARALRTFAHIQPQDSDEEEDCSEECLEENDQVDES
jgi:hypothetical protein